MHGGASSTRCSLLAAHETAVVAPPAKDDPRDALKITLLRLSLIKTTPAALAIPQGEILGLGRSAATSSELTTAPTRPEPAAVPSVHASASTDSPFKRSTRPAAAS
jgi:hypothetical protein